MAAARVGAAVGMPVDMWWHSPNPSRAPRTSWNGRNERARGHGLI